MSMTIFEFLVDGRIDRYMVKLRPSVVAHLLGKEEAFKQHHIYFDKMSGVVQLTNKGKPTEIQGARATLQELVHQLGGTINWTDLPK